MGPGRKTDGNSINVRWRDGEDIGETTVDAFVKGMPPYTVPALAASLREQTAEAAE